MLDKNLEFIEGIYKTMSEEQLFLSYIGNVTKDIADALLKSLKNNDLGVEGELHIKKKVYNIMVECLENICRHSDSFDHSLPPSIVLLGKSTGHYFIISGNFVYIDQIDNIREMIAGINSLDKEGIKEKYREILSKREISEKGGAGLGMYDIAIKSGNPLECDFRQTGDSICLYVLKVKVNF